MKNIRLLLTLIAILAGACVAKPTLCQQMLYSVSSKSQGATFDLVVTEVKREPNKSYLSVPGFQDRTAPGARWLMCAFTDLTIKRGFSYWQVIYPPSDSNVIILGLANSPNASAKEIFGNEYDKERVLDKDFSSIEPFIRFCGMRR